MKPQAATLTPRIRELLRQRSGASLADGFSSLLDNLLELSKQSRTTEDHRLILQTLEHIDRNKRGLAEAFERHLLALYDEKLGWLRESDRTSGAPRAFGEFNLLDDNAFAQQVALKKLVHKTLEEIDKGDFIGIEVRLRDLFETSIDGARNPVGPGTVIKAAQRACAAGLEDEAVLATLINALQPHLAAGLRQLYRELNGMLIEAGVLPDYRPTIERDTSNRYARRNTDGSMTVSQVMSLRDLLPNRTSSPLDLKEILAALLAGSAGNRQYGARMLADEEGSLYANAIETPVNSELLRALTERQKDTLHAAGVDEARDLHAVVEHMASADAHPLDRLTGELVTVVFDFLLRDRALPETVKNELARLQIVALKAALLDRSFFARREHPLRALLDEIVRLSSDPTLDVSADGRFVSGLRDIVDEVLTGFEAELSLFDAATAQLHSISIQAAAQDEQALAETTAALLAEERLAHVQSAATEAVAKGLRIDTPPFLRAFLEQAWALALTDARMNHAGDALWDERIRVMEALQDSVKPRLRHELPPFVASLPGLVRDVQAGSKAAGTPADIVRPFMDELMAAHTAVLQMRSMAPTPSVAPAKGASVAQPETVTYDARPTTVLLQRGDVVELYDREPPVRAKLIWVSPARSRYLFSTGGAHSRTLTADELSNALANGIVRPVERDNLLNRALAAVAGTGEQKQQ